MDSNCIVPLCDEPVHNRGLCLAHFEHRAEQVASGRDTWKAAEQRGDATPALAQAFRCKYEGCKATGHKAKGYCFTHYSWYRYHQGKGNFESVIPEGDTVEAIKAALRANNGGITRELMQRMKAIGMQHFMGSANVPGDAT